MRYPCGAAVAVVGLLAVGCGGDDNGFEPDLTNSGELLFVNASPAADTVDVLMQSQTALSDVPFGGAVTRFVPPGRYTMTVQSRREGADPATITVSVSVGLHYTMLAAGPLDTLDLLFALDTAAVPAPGTVKFRVIHAAPGAEPLDVYLTAAGADLGTANRLVFPFTYGTGSSSAFPGYVQRDPGTYQVRFTAEGTTTVLVDTGPIAVTAGQVRTVVLHADAGGALDYTVVSERD